MATSPVRAAELKSEEGKDIWLMGGGRLFRSLLAARVVDGVEVAIAPLLLGEGVPLLPAGTVGARLERPGIEEFPASGLVLLSYDIAPD